MKVIYMTYDVPVDSVGDVFNGQPTFSKDEALRSADAQWAYLTQIERRKRCVYVGVHTVDVPEGDTRSADQIYNDLILQDEWPVDHNILDERKGA